MTPANITSLIIALMAGLNVAALRAFREDSSFLPDVREPWRQGLVLALSMIIGPALEGAINGSAFWACILTGLGAASPVIGSWLVSLGKRRVVIAAVLESTKAELRKDGAL